MALSGCYSSSKLRSEGITDNMKKSKPSSRSLSPTPHSLRKSKSISPKRPITSDLIEDSTDSLIQNQTKIYPNLKDSEPLRKQRTTPHKEGAALNLTLTSKDSSLSSSLEDLRGKINILRPKDAKDPVWESYDQISHLKKIINAYILNLKKNHKRKPSVISSKQNYNNYNTEITALKLLREDLQDKILNTIHEVSMPPDKKSLLRKLVEDDLTILSTFTKNREDELKISAKIWLQDNVQRINPTRKSKVKALEHPVWSSLKPRQRNRNPDLGGIIPRLNLTGLRGDEEESLAWDSFFDNAGDYDHGQQASKEDSCHLQDQVGALRSNIEDLFTLSNHNTHDMRTLSNNQGFIIHPQMDSKIVNQMNYDPVHDITSLIGELQQSKLEDDIKGVGLKKPDSMDQHEKQDEARVKFNKKAEVIYKTSSDSGSNLKTKNKDYDFFQSLVNNEADKSTPKGAKPPSHGANCMCIQCASFLWGKSDSHDPLLGTAVEQSNELVNDEFVKQIIVDAILDAKSSNARSKKLNYVLRSEIVLDIDRMKLLQTKVKRMVELQLENIQNLDKIKTFLSEEIKEAEGNILRNRLIEYTYQVSAMIKEVMNSKEELVNSLTLARKEFLSIERYQSGSRSLNRNRDLTPNKVTHEDPPNTIKQSKANKDSRSRDDARKKFTDNNENWQRIRIMNPKIRRNETTKGNQSSDVEDSISEAPRERQLSDIEDSISETPRDRQPLNDHDEEIIENSKLLRRSNCHLQDILDSLEGMEDKSTSQISDMLKSKDRAKDASDKAIYKSHELRRELRRAKNKISTDTKQYCKNIIAETEMLDEILIKQLRKLTETAKQQEISINKIGSSIAGNLKYPTFYGAATSVKNPHLFEWLAEMKQKFKAADIPKALRAIKMKEHLHTNVKTIINLSEDSCQTEDEIIQQLKDNFGNVFNILQTIMILHKEVGKIPMLGDGSQGQLELRANSANQHFTLIKKAEVLLKFDNDDQLKRAIYNPAHAVELQEYLPIDVACRLKNIELINPSSAYDSVRKAFERIQSESSIIYTRGACRIKHEKEPSQNPPRRKKEHTALYVSTAQKCDVCDLLKSQGVGENYYQDHQHSDKGIAYGAKCPLYLKMTMDERQAIFSSGLLCRYDISAPGPKHRSPFRECKKRALMRKREWICNEQGCPERKEVCKEHKEKNITSLEKHAENMAKQNLEFVFTCVNNKALITKTSQRKKYDSRTNMDSDRPLLVKTKKELLMTAGVEPRLERNGKSLLFFMNMKGATRPLATIFDTGCTTVLVKDNVPGIQLLATIKNNENSTLSGIGGQKRANNSYTLLLPLIPSQNKNKRFAPVEALSVSEIIDPLETIKTSRGTNYLKKEFPKIEQIQNANIYPEIGGKLDILIGNKHIDLYPTLIHQTVHGLGIYSLKLQSHDEKFNACLGGNLESFMNVEKQFANKELMSFAIEEGLLQIDDGVLPKINMYNVPDSHLKDLLPSTSNSNPKEQRKDSEKRRIMLTTKDDSRKFTPATNIPVKQEVKVAGPISRTDDLSNQECLISASNKKFINKLKELVGSDLEMNTQKCTNCKQEEKDERISINEEREEKLLKDSIWLDPAENRFIARLPTTGNPNILLEDNKESTDNSIRNVLRRLKGNEEDISEIKGSFKKLLDKSFIVKLSDMDEEVRKDINEKVKFYIPFTLAYKSTSISTPVRIVFDASRKTSSGNSLNDILPKGKSDLALDRMATNFAMKRVAIVGDISKFYNSFILDPSQYNLQLLRWQPDLDPYGELETYVITTLIYGVKSVARQTEIALELLIEKIRETDPEVSRLLSLARYVDDLGSSANSIKEAEDLRDRADHILRGVGLKVKGWVISGQAPSSELSYDGTVAVAGYNWNPKDDTIKIRIPTVHFGIKKKGKILTSEVFNGGSLEDLKRIVPEHLTLRHVAGRMSSIFDVRGIVSPFTSDLKQLLSDTMMDCLEELTKEGKDLKNKNEWDHILSNDRREQWIQALWRVEQLRNVVFPRNSMSPNSQFLDGHLHVFVDASGPPKPKLQQVAYLSFPNQDGSWNCQFIYAKNQLGKRDRSVPKNELEASYQGALIAHNLEKFLKPNIKTKSLYTDSKIVCHWVTNDSKTLAIFERRRVTSIKKIFKPNEIYYIPSEGNPADVGTRMGVKIEDVLPHSRFHAGPGFIKLGLPRMISEGLVCPSEKVLTYEKGSQYQDGLKVQIVGIISTETTKSMKERIKFSEYIINPLYFGWVKGIRIIAIAFKFIKRLLQNLGNNKHFSKRSAILQASLFDSVKDSLLPHELISKQLTPMRPKEHVINSNQKHSPNKFLQYMGGVHPERQMVKAAAWYLLKKANMEAKKFCSKRTLMKHGRIENKYLVDNKRWHYAASITDTLEIQNETPEIGIKCKTMFIDKDSPIALIIAQFIHDQIAVHRGADTCYVISLNFIYIHGGKTLFEKICANCTKCKRLNKKRIKVHCGPLNEAQLTIGAVFNTIQLDCAGPWEVRASQVARQTRGRPQKTKVWTLHAVCMISHLSKSLILEDYSANGFISALQSISCEYGVPKICLIDPSTSEMAALTKSVISIQDLNSQTYERTGIEVRMCPTGPSSHARHGLVERRIGLIKKTLDIHGHDTKNLTIIEFQRILELADNHLNSIPLGLATSHDRSIAAKIISPNHFKLGRSNTRVIDGQIQYPTNRGVVLESIEKLSTSMINYFKKTAIPQLIPKPKWAQEKGDTIMEKDIVMFKKTEGSLTQSWHLGMVEEVIKGKDNAVRIVEIKYSNSSEIELPLSKSDNVTPSIKKRYTTRTARSLVKLYSIEDPNINEDIIEIHDWYKKERC